nr:MAG: glycoprotein precursor [Sanya phasmavirus 2]
MMRISLLVVFLTLAVFRDTTAVKGKFSITFGKITVENFKECVIIGQDSQYVYNSSVDTSVPGLWFGLVSFTCDKVVGHEVSKFKCKDCGIYCPYNEYIEGCTTSVPYWTGVTLGCIIGTLMCAISWCICGCYFPSIIDWAVYKLAKKRDRKAVKECMKLARLAKVTCTPDFKPIPAITDTRKARLERERSKVAMRQGIEAALAASKQSTLKSHSIGAGGSAPRTQGTRLYPDTIMVLTVIFMILGVCIGCDTNIYLASENKLCVSKQCYDVSTFQMALTKGELMCFTDSKGYKFQVKITSIKIVKRYSLMYYTSEFDIDSRSQYECAANGDCKRGNYKCKAGYISPRYQSYHNYTLQGYSCSHASGYCSTRTFCIEDSVCVYYKWWVTPKGIHYPVYKETQSTWEIDFLLIHKTHSMTYRISTGKPYMNMADLVQTRLTKIPLVVNSVLYPHVYTDSHLIVVGREAYFVSASQRNMPNHNNLGDFQISLDTKEESIDTSMIQCEVSGCVATCTAPESKLRRMLDNLPQFPKALDYVTLYNDDTLEARIQVEGSATTTIGNIKVDSLMIDTPSCKLSVIMTYGCKSCTDLPSVIIGASDIKKGGSVPFASNCTFDTEILSCNEEPIKLILKETAASCYLTAPSLNQTLSFNIEYKYLGHLSPTLIMSTQDTALGALKHILTTDDFINMISTTAIYFSIMGTITTISIRAMTIYYYRKTSNDIRMQTLPQSGE